MVAVPGPASAQERLPSFAELEAAGATFGEIRIAARDIFDLSDPKEDYRLFRLANALHIQTRPGVIERALLFKSGDPVSVRLIEETERLLRSNRYLYEVQFRVLAVHDGVADVEVATRDTWSLDIGGSVGRQGGANSSGVQIHEYNLLGTGVSVSLGRSRTVDRSGTELQLANPRALGTWTSIAWSRAHNSDGNREAASVVHPFYALDTHWAAGASFTKDDRIDSVYSAGKIASQYRHRLKQGEVFGGWSEGLVDGWVNRFSAGLTLQDDAYAAEPGLAAPAAMPGSQRLAGPFLRWELIEDRYEREFNRNLIGRPEFFALGWASSVQLGWAAPGLGSSAGAMLYTASASRGVVPWPEQMLVAAAKLSGQVVDGQERHQALGVQTQYYVPQSPRWLFYAAAAADVVRHADIGELLQLGGDNGLRGYPLRYQAGTRRALFTVEERFYTDLYVWQLFRIGGAAFFDVGRAWGGGGESTNTVNPGWLKNAGVGLRIVSARSAFSNVLHIDLAMPLDATSDIKKVQLLVKTKASF
ncbi:MAG: hypothetical protein U1F25_18225 [Rubrivivax sp.]